jgi:MFS transporter, DHA3 family, multidrug efflux protein
MEPVPAVDGEPISPLTSEVATRTFHQLLVNTLVSGVSSSFLWFALTFWVYLETRSVVATGVIGGAFTIASAVLGPVVGTYVDRQRKLHVMRVTTALSAVCFGLATVVFVSFPAGDLLDMTSPWFWLLVMLTLFGSVAGNLRHVAMSTLVTLLVPADRRDRANGLVGTVSGISFAITSVFSGLVIGMGGMGWAYGITLVLTALALGHLFLVEVPEPEIVHDPEAPQGFVDIRGALDAIGDVPGLWLLIGLAAFNNLLGGVFMALMDAYGLELVSVEAWGFLWGGLSFGFILGGLAVARFGLGPVPVRTIVVANLINWTACAVMALRPSIVLLAVGTLVWILLMPVIEASEQTVLQRAIPFERQGRVFGFAQLVENAASPLTAFMVAPVAEAFVIPFMTDGWGADAIGDWFGTGVDRGIGLMFTVAGLIGIVATLAVMRSRSYRLLVASTTTASVPAFADERSDESSEAVLED